MPHLIKMSRAQAIVATALLQLAACNSSSLSSETGKDGSPDGTKAEADGGGICQFEPTGAFTFHLHNSSTTPLVADLGCGRAFPMMLETPSGTFAAAPGNVTQCEYTCDLVYSDQIAGWACTDCGPGYLGQLPPGATLDFAWDRRVYVASEAYLDCGSGSCARGKAVPPATAQTGALTLCRQGQLSFASAPCTGPVPVAFTIDTMQPDGTIEVNLP